MATGLELKVGADVSDAISGVKLLGSQLERLAKLASLPGLSFTQQERLNALLIKTQAQFDKFGRAAELAGRRAGGIAPGANQAAFALSNLGRVAQDAPFGFIGIQNNINPLIESFGRLKQETGTSGAALKALASSFIGPAGIGVAVSLVTSAITFFVQAQQKAKREAKELTKDTDGYVKKLTEEKEQVLALVNVVNNKTLSEKDHANALKKLNDIIPDTIGKLTKQNITTSEGINIVRQYVKALEAQATAELLIGRIAENNVKLFDNRTNVLNETKRIDNEILEIEKRIGRQNQAGNFAASVAARQKIRDLQKEQTDIQAKGRVEAEKLLQTNQQIRAAYEQILPVAIKLEKDKQKAAKESNDILEDYRNQLAALTFKETATGADLLREKLDLATKTFQDFLEKGIKPNTTAFQFINAEVQKFIGQLPQIQKIAKRIETISKLDPTIKLPQVQQKGVSISKADQTGPEVITPEALQRQGQYSLLLDEMAAKIKGLSDISNTFIDSFFGALASNQDPFKALAESAKRLVFELGAAVLKALALKAITAALTGGASAGLEGLTGGGGGLLNLVLRGDLLTGAIGGDARRRRGF